MEKDNSWLHYILYSLSASQLQTQSVDTLVKGGDRFEQLQQQFPNKSLKDYREMMSPFFKTENLKERIRKKIEKVKMRIGSAAFMRKKDKWTFTIGLMRIGAEFYLLGRAPCLYPIWHTFWACFLLIARLVYYRILKYHYFLFDFCYYANLLLLAFLWRWQDSAWLFSVVWSYSVGPLLFAVPLYNNMIVLQHIDKTTSNFIHVSPALTLWAIRWADCSTYPVVTETPSLSSYYFPAIGLYFAWAVLYYFIIFVLTFQRCKTKHNLTLYTWMMEDPRAVPYRLSGVLGEDWRPLVFMACHLVVFSVGLVVSYLAMLSFVFNTLLLIGICALSVWKAASYYMEFFAKDYEKKLAELEELSKQQ